ncbi:MAG: diguanylate cyclase [Pseudomonadota bacterium]
MNIRTRVLVSAALAVVATLCCGVLLWIGATRSLAADAEQERVQATSRLIAGLVALTNEYALHSEPRTAEQWQLQHAALAGTLSAPVQSGETSAARLALRSSVAELPELFRGLTELPPRSDAPLTERRRDLLVDQLLARVQALADAAYRWSREAADAEQAARRQLRIAGAGALLLLLATTLAQPIIVWRRVLRPLAVLDRAATAVKHGDLTARCASTARDELGHVARRFDAMTAALGERSAALQRSKQRLRAIADNLPALITQVDAGERYTFVNDYIERGFGVSREVLIGKTMREVSGGKKYAEYLPHIHAALQGEPAAFETSLVVRGELRHFQSSYIPERGDDGTVRGFYAISFDITERKRSEMQHAASERRLRTITDNLPALITHVDSAQRYQFLNAQIGRVFGLDLDQVLGRTMREARGETTYALLEPHVAAALRGEANSFEYVDEVHGALRHYQSNYVPDVDAEGTVHGFFAMTFDITELKETQRRLEQLARVDALTGLPNRRQYDERLGEAMERARRTRFAVALLFLDVDHFKAINDSLGHAGGDAVLKEFARRLKQTVRATDTVARLAGDEFVIILDALRGAAEAELVARKILQAVRDDFLIDGGTRRVTTSIGVALFEGDAATPAELMARADAALYAAKGAGRNGYSVARGAAPLALVVQGR